MSSGHGTAAVSGNQGWIEDRGVASRVRWFANPFPVEGLAYSEAAHSCR